MPKRSTTIKDVAISAKVSIATVSNVLNGKDDLYSAETAEVVWAAVKGLDYRPNRVARSLVQQCTDTLGVVIDSSHGRLTRNSYINGLLDGFLEYSAHAGYQIKLFSMLSADQSAALAQLEDGSVDGLALFGPPSDSPLIAWAQEADMPLVFAGTAPPGRRFAAADFDDCASAREAVSWLIAQGHTRIGWLAGPYAQWSTLRREEGYLQAMRAAELEVLSGWRYMADHRMESGAVGAVALLEADPTLTAILCWNDWLALGALQGLQDRGLRVPEDVSLVGFDDIEAAHWVRPALTTVQQPLGEIGMKAAEMLVRQINLLRRCRTDSAAVISVVTPSEISSSEIPASEKESVLFKGSLVVRDSVARLRDDADDR